MEERKEADEGEDEGLLHLGVQEREMRVPHPLGLE
jgi:hypothetical protein